MQFSFPFFFKIYSQICATLLLSTTTVFSLVFSKRRQILAGGIYKFPFQPPFFMTLLLSQNSAEDHPSFTIKSITNRTARFFPDFFCKDPIRVYLIGVFSNLNGHKNTLLSTKEEIFKPSSTTFFDIPRQKDRLITLRLLGTFVQDEGQLSCFSKTNFPG